MGTPPDPQPFIPGPSRPWTQMMLTALIAGTAVYLVASHWLHVLDALPYLGVVLMMGMHLLMHGGHGHRGAGHGGGGRPAGGAGAGHGH